MPLGKRRKFIDVNWVDENIVSQIPAECLEKVKSLQESVNLPSVSCIKTASLSVADSDSALVATSWVARAVRCFPDFQLTLPRAVRVRVYG